MRYIRKITGTALFTWSEALSLRHDMVECDAKGRILGTFPETTSSAATAVVASGPAPAASGMIVSSEPISAAAIAKAAEAAPVATPEPVKAEDTAQETEPPKPLDEMTKIELQLTARERGIKYKPQDNKAKLLAAIQATEPPVAASTGVKADAGE